LVVVKNHPSQKGGMKRRLLTISERQVVLEHAQDFSSMQRQKQAELATSQRLDGKS